MSRFIMQKRGVRIITAEPARVPPNFILGFAHRGGYATLMDKTHLKSTDPDLAFPGPHGVLYAMKQRELCAILNRETGYLISSIDVTTYSGTNAEARVFCSQRLLQLRQSLPPRQQYLDLLVTGAREHGLCEEYCQWLQAVPALSPGTTLGPEYFDTDSEALAKLAVASLALAGGLWAARHGSIQ